MNFLAIDFETADYGPDSACALGLVKVREGSVLSRRRFLIRPPRPDFIFTYIHGIQWKDVRDKPAFPGLWPEIREEFEGIDFIAAHNARFDKSVLQACCRAAGVPPPDLPYLCTVQLARSLWNLRPANLPAVCRHLAIKLDHHEALSDAEACARIVLAARQDERDPMTLQARARRGLAREGLTR